MFVDQFGLSLLYALEALYTDMAHFSVSDMTINPIIDDILGKTGLYDQDGDWEGNGG